MSDDAFHAAIRANPVDDTPRLVYADWLDEQAERVPCGDCSGSGRKPKAVRRVCAWCRGTGTARTGPPRTCRQCKGAGTKPTGGAVASDCGTCSGVGRVSDGRAERAEFIRLQCPDIPHLQRLIAKPYEDQDLCTDLSANWCPTCGDCACPSPEDAKDHPDCPLHSEESRHHSDESLRARLERSLTRESALLTQWGPEWSRPVAEALGVTDYAYSPISWRFMAVPSGPEWWFARGFVAVVRVPTLAEAVGDRACPTAWHRGTSPFPCPACAGLGRVRACPACGGERRQHCGRTVCSITSRTMGCHCDCADCLGCVACDNTGTLPPLGPAVAAACPGLVVVECSDREPASNDPDHETNNGRDLDGPGTVAFTGARSDWFWRSYEGGRYTVPTHDLPGFVFDQLEAATVYPGEEHLKFYPTRESALAALGAAVAGVVREGSA